MRSVRLALIIATGCKGTPQQHADAMLGDANGDGGDGAIVDAAPIDAPPESGFRVGGTALGMREPAQLRLVANGLRHAIVSHDGAFWFPGRLADATPFTVTTSNSNCYLVGGTGTISGADVTNLRLYCRGVVELASVVFSSGSPLAPFAHTQDHPLVPPFKPTIYDYVSTRPYFMDTTDSISAVPTAAYGNEPTITVYTDATPSGTASPPHAIGSGPTITLAHGPLNRTYSVPMSLGNPAQQAYVKASNTAASDSFGSSIAISGDTLVVGAASKGAVYVFRRTAVNATVTWAQQGPPLTIAEAGASFGASVAIDGDVLVVGAPLANTTAVDSGAAYVFRRSGGVWTVDATPLTSPAPATGDDCGYAVAISGSNVIMSCVREDGTGPNTADLGGVYFFRDGASWARDALHPMGTSQFERFGDSVAMSGDTAVVGAPLQDTGAANSGAAFVYVRTTNWAQQGSALKINPVAASDEFGRAVAIDGNTLAVGGSGETVAGRPSVGGVRVYTRSGTIWTLDAVVRSPRATAVTPPFSEEFGRAVAIDKEHLVVGARFEPSNEGGIDPQYDGTGGLSGAIYTFRRGTSGWGSSHFVKASNAGQDDRFGSCVALDGEWFAAGAPNEDSNATGIGGDQLNEAASESGAAYIFR